MCYKKVRNRRMGNLKQRERGDILNITEGGNKRDAGALGHRNGNQELVSIKVPLGKEKQGKSRGRLESKRDRKFLLDWGGLLTQL